MLLHLLVTTLLLLCFWTISCTAHASANSNSAEAFRVDGLKKWGVDDVMFAGMMPLDALPNEDKGSFFFWLAESRKMDGKNTPLIVWLNGGPGCSSMVGMFYENGPWLPPTLGADGKGYAFTRNVNSWNEVGHVLYVEQPLRTGFSIPAQSHGDVVANEYQVGQDFYAFLLSFYKTFPEYVDSPLIVSGESWSGRYIPNIAREILQRQEKSPEDVRMRLHGVLIGNGAIDPEQDQSHAAYAYFHGLIPLGAKLAIENHAAACAGQQARSDDAKDALGVSHDAQMAVEALGEVEDCENSMMVHVLKAAGQPNEYNTATFVGYDDLLLPDGPFHKFFNDEAVQRALHIINPADSVRTWTVCSDVVDRDMRHDSPASSVPALQFLANHIRVLLYSGENDLNCNFLGTQRVLEKHKWLGRSWQEAEHSLWRGADPQGSEVFGEYFSLDERMSFLIIRNSGHLVPMDQPVVALDLIRRFAASATYADTKLPSEASYYASLAKSMVQESKKGKEKAGRGGASGGHGGSSSGSSDGSTDNDSGEADADSDTLDVANSSIPEDLEYFKALFLAKVAIAVNTAEQGGGGAVHYLAPVALIGLIYCICSCGGGGGLGDSSEGDVAMETRDGKQYAGLQSADTAERGGAAAAAAGRGRVSYQLSE